MIRRYTNFRIISFFFCLIVLPVLSMAQKDLSTTEFQIEQLRQRLISDAIVDKGFVKRTERYIISDFGKTAMYLRNMTTEGKWEDVDYADDDNSWHPLNALDRMLTMTYAYRNTEDSLYFNAELLEGIVRSLQYWYQVQPHCKNWYKNEIAKQFYFNVIGLLLQDHIEDDLLNKISGDLTEAPRMTGSNRTLLSISVLYRGVNEKNEEQIQSGIAGVMNQVTKGEPEGIQVDQSFHQHGPFLYNGGLSPKE